MIFATSCENELELGAAGEESVVSFTISTPNMGSRAYSDGTTATVLQYAVYDAAGKELTDLTVTDDDNVEIQGSTTVNLTLTTGNTYSVIFWAAAPSTTEKPSPYTVDFANKTMTVDYTNAVSNDESRDAFYKYETFTVNGAEAKTIELKRPFAQLNIGTNDYVASTSAGYTPTHSAVTVKNIYETLDLVEGEVDDEVEATFGYASIPVANDGVFPVTGYEYLAMNYLLVDAEKETVEVTFSYKDANNNEKTRTVGSVPVQRNYRTNIYGQLLTSDVDINVTIDPEYDNSYLVEAWDGKTLTEPAYDATTKTYTITHATDLAYIAALVNGTLDTDKLSRAVVAANSLKGYTIKLESDINLGGEEWTPIGMGSKHFQGTFDGQNHTIHGLKISERPNGTSQAALFGTVSGSVTISNLTIKGANIDGLKYTKEDFYGSALIGTMYGNVTIENVKVLDSYISGNNKVGALIAHDGVGTLVSISGCEVNRCTFKSTNTADGGLVGGIIGYFQSQANTHEIKNTKVLNCKFNVVNSTNTGKRANSEFIGGIDSKKGQVINITDCVVSGNTWNEKFYENGVEVTEDKYESRYVANDVAWIGGERDDKAEGKVFINNKLYVNSAYGLQAAIDATTGESTIYLGANIVGNVTVVQKAGVKITLEGEGKKYNGTIKVHSNSNHYADAALTIKNVNFETSAASVNVIEALENGSERYSTNITVENCTFTATGEAVKTAVGVQIKSSKNAKVIDCTAKDMHSLIQAQSCDESVLVKGCEVNGKNGVAFKQVKAATVEGTTINALEYGIRFDGNTDNYGIVVKDNEVTANQPFIVRKMTGKDNTITLEGENTLTTEAEYQIVITNGSDDEAYVKPTGTYTLTGADKFTIFPVEPVAKVGNTEYTSIDEAIAAWANGTTLTLVKDVTLSDVITLKSTEHHILNLGTYTMTAASGENAIVIKACGNGSAERTAITINADATNPGGINAGNKSIIYYKYADGGISTEDRPIIKINGGVFTGSTNTLAALGSVGIFTIGSEARKCATIDITGGTFNCSIVGNSKSKLLISGGVFNYSVSSQGDSTALRLISGGKFKTIGFMTADSNNTKFWFGTKMATSNVGLYIDKDGYLVVGGPVITEFGDKFAAKATNATKWSSYLQYSSAAANGLYYEDAQMAIKKHGEANVVLK